MEKDNNYDAIKALESFNHQANLLASAIVKEPYMFPILSEDVNGLLKEYQNISPVEKIFPVLDESPGSGLPLSIIREANLSISNLTFDNINLFTESVKDNPSGWITGTQKANFLEAPKLDLDYMGAMGCDISKLSELSIEANLTKISWDSLLAENSLSSFSWDKLGGLLDIGTAIKDNLSDSFMRLSDSYNDLFKTLEMIPTQFIDLGSSLVTLTPLEYFNASDLCEVISPKLEQPIDKTSKKTEILKENEENLENYLSEIDKDLLILWRGANAALKSSNPDSIRHFSISIRELFTHVLHNLAPDEEIRKWSKEANYFYDNKPTRKARLMYICRNIDNGPFKAFVGKDVTATLEFINLFQEGTHGIKSLFTPEQISVLKRRAESTLIYIANVSHQNETRQ